MKKILILIVILLLITISIFLIYSNISKKNLTGKAVTDYHTLTKAICNETNYCQDYEISCNGKQVISLNPITGAAVQKSENWEDPRNKSERELC